jgi:hypothetical protein
MSAEKRERREPGFACESIGLIAISVSIREQQPDHGIIMFKKAKRGK